MIQGVSTVVRDQLIVRYNNNNDINNIYNNDSRCLNSSDVVRELIVYDDKAPPFRSHARTHIPIAAHTRAFEFF